ncbi:MAG TPA: peptidoglycan editing factor PgeF [Mycobacteriales bacterium]|nr:peptidoglycan editing factor PgeF [Mycobacteriales bacterium]
MPVLFTTRAGGRSQAPYAHLNLATHVGDDPEAVAANRRTLAARLGLPADHLLWMDQVHGATVAEVTAPAVGVPSAVASVDGMVTATPRLGLAVLVADCVPVLLEGSAAVAVAHAGRRGAAAGIALTALSRLRRHDPGPVIAHLGPAICGRCYEVPAAMQAQVEEALPGSAVTTSRGTPGLDLRAGLAAQLRAAGAEVRVDARCTAQEPDLYSHRRDNVTGRFAGVVWLA